MDEFERRLSVALKTAVADLPVAAGAPPRPEFDPAVAGPSRRGRSRRGRSRLLVAAVVVLLVAAIGGTWWAIVGAHEHRATPAGAACTADDVVATQVGTLPSGTALGPSAEIEVDARTACTLTAAPSLLLNADPVYWRTSDPDAVDPAAWVPIPLAAGGHATFTLRNQPFDGHANCPDMVERGVEVGFGLAGVVLLRFQETAITACSSLFFTTSFPAPPPASDASAPCTAADVDVVPHDLGDGIDSVGIDVVAKVGCTLQQSPEVTVDGIATSPDVRGNPVPAWQRTRLAAGQSVTLAVNPNYSGSCTTYGPRRVAAGLDGVALVDFTWTTVISCPGTGFGLEPRPLGVTAAHPCTAHDLAMTPALDDSVATLRFTAPDGAACTLVDPPTVLTGDDLAPFGLDADLHTFGGWTPQPVGPGHDVTIEISADPHYQACNGRSHQPHLFTVGVRVGAASVGTFAWSYVGCGDTVVTTLR